MGKHEHVVGPRPLLEVRSAKIGFKNEGWIPQHFSARIRKHKKANEDQIDIGWHRPTPVQREEGTDHGQQLDLNMMQRGQAMLFG